MPRFRKKPVIIEAVQFFKDTEDGWPDGVRTEGGDFFIDTPEGPLRFSEGDWIITGVMGEKYPCKPEIFEKTYEPVD